MRRFRFRFTVRRMLIAIAALAVVLGGGREGFRLWVRAYSNSLNAEYYGDLAREYRDAVAERRESHVFSCFPPDPNEPPPTPERIADMRHLAAEYAVKERLYRKAAARPWVELSLHR